MRNRIDSCYELYAVQPACNPALQQRKGLAPLAPTAPQRRVVALSRADSAIAAAGGAGGDATPAPAAPAFAPSAPGSDWGAFTDRLVGLSTLPFIFLFLPQVRCLLGMLAGCPPAGCSASRQLTQTPSS